jgi:nitrogen-specific signal transduction histidine kinase
LNQGLIEGRSCPDPTVTDHRKDELRRHQDRMATVGATLAGVAHELNNPLAAIVGFSQLLLKKSWPDEDRAALEAIRHEASRSAAIVKDLLALVRKRSVSGHAPTDLNDVVSYIARTRRYTFETAGIACVLELDPRLPFVVGERTQLEQVVLNLLNNAEQALRASVDAPKRPQGGRITIRTRRDGPNVRLDVEDNGPGIPDDVQNEIWNPFWTSRTGGGEGTGLGLVIVRDIVADHGGAVELDASVPGVTRFSIRLPACIESVATKSEVQMSRPLDVLVVDVDATEMSFVERFLSARGHAVTNVKSADAALQLATRATFDAVVCDGGLTSRDGASVTASLRALPGCARARFVGRPSDVEELRRLVERD